MSENKIEEKEETKNTQTQLVVKSDQNTSKVCSNLYNIDLVDYGIYKNFNYIDISSIPNLNKKICNI